MSSGAFAAFISYSHKDRLFGAQAQAVLSSVGIDAFLAHEDLRVSDEWRARILSELQTCSLFVPLLSKNFLASRWAPQEAGFITSRPEVVIAPLSIDRTTPPGFLSHVQSRRIPHSVITRELLIDPLVTRVPRVLLPRLIRIAAGAASCRDAEAKMHPMVEHFPVLTRTEARALAEASINNGQIYSARLCRDEYLPRLIRLQRRNIGPEILRILRERISGAI